jgi:hypothetical protein
MSDGVLIFPTPEPSDHEKALAQAKRRATRRRNAERKKLASGPRYVWRQCQLEGCGVSFRVASEASKRLYCERRHKELARRRRRAHERRIARLKELGIDLDEIIDFRRLKGDSS